VDRRWPAAVHLRSRSAAGKPVDRESRRGPRRAHCFRSGSRDPRAQRTARGSRDSVPVPCARGHAPIGAVALDETRLVLRRLQDRRELAGPGGAAWLDRSGRAAPGKRRSRHRRDLLVPQRRRRRPVRGGAQAAEGFRMPAPGRAWSLDLEPARRRADPVSAPGGPGGGRERRADLRRRRRAGCGCPGGTGPGGDDESGRCRQVAGLLRRAAARRARRDRSRSGRRRRRACRERREGAARRCRRGTHPRARGSGGERRRLPGTRGPRRPAGLP
jgi:hypothetical protein